MGGSPRWRMTPSQKAQGCGQDGLSHSGEQGAQLQASHPESNDASISKRGQVGSGASGTFHRQEGPGLSIRGSERWQALGNPRNEHG